MRAEIITGDVLSVLPTLAAGSVDMVLTDPPYNSGALWATNRKKPVEVKYHNTSGVTYGGDSRDQRAFTFWATMWLAECLRISASGAFLVSFIDWRQLPALTDAVQAAGWLWRGVAAWDKTPAVRPYAPSGGVSHQCEYVVWATKGAPSKVPNISGVVRSPTPRERVHRAQKPLPVLAHFVQLCRPGGVVLDPFAGSGSSGIAALRSGRRFIGVEIDNAIAADARARLAAITEPAQELELIAP